MKKLLIKNQILTIIFVVFLFTRLLFLNEVPFGLHVDEAGMAYDAFSLANWGVDRYLNSYPVYLINYGDGQSALYAYMTMFLIKLFGLSILTIRLPAVIISISTFFIGYKSITDILNSKYYGYLFALLFTILPYFIMQSRFGLDCNLMMGLSSMMLYFIHKMIKVRSKCSYFLAGLFSGLILYTYALSYIVMPIFLIIIVLYMMWTKTLTLRYVPFFIIPLLILAFPLILMVFVNSMDLDPIQFIGITVPKLPNYRGSGFTITKFSENLKLIIKSVFMYDQLTYNSFIKFYTMYKISIPFILIGILKGLFELFKSLKLRLYSPILIYWFFALSVFIMGILLSEQLNTNKLNGIFFSIIILLIYGIYETEKLIKMFINHPIFIKLFYVSLITLYSISFIGFAKYYYFEYKFDIYPQTLFTHTFIEEIDYIESNNVHHKIVYTENNIDSNFQGYIYFLLSANVSPYEFMNRKLIEGYKNYRFGMPEEINLDAYYIVLKINNDFIVKLNQFNFNRIEFDHFFIYEPIT